MNDLWADADLELLHSLKTVDDRGLPLKAAMLRGAAMIGSAKGSRQVKQKDVNCRRSSSYPGTGSGKPCFSDGLMKAVSTTFGSTKIPPISTAVRMAAVR